MKSKVLFPIFAVLLFAFAACNNSGSQSAATSPEGEQAIQHFGKQITEDKAVDLGVVMEKVKQDNTGKITLKAKGEVEAVCQMKGCWMTLKTPDGGNMRVTFKDYGFFVPKDISGKEVIMEGFAYTDTTSVETLRHYAEDEGLPQSEIDKITEPEINIAFEAEGVIVK